MKQKKSVAPKLLLALLLLAVAALAAYLILNHYIFVIRRVEVHGAENYAAEDVIRLAQIPIGRPLTALSEEKTRLSVESSGQFAFESLEIRRPSTVVLTVRERTVAALIQNAGTLIAVDGDAVVMGNYTDLDNRGLIYISGLSMQHFTPGKSLDANAETLRAISATLAALRSVDAVALVSELNVADAQQLYLYSRTGIRVALGNADNLDRKLQWMKSALLDLESRGETEGKLDVSSGSKADYTP